jgi:antitoxin MazE
MKVSKWGNSLAIRVPAEIAAKLKLKSGDEIQIAVTGEHKFEVSRDRRRQEALEKLKKLRFELPANYKFNRDQIYDRHGR